MRTYSDLVRQFSNPEAIQASAFDTLQDLASFASDPEHEEAARDLALRLHEHRSVLGALDAPFNSILRALGLYSHIRPETTRDSDLLAYETHRPVGLGDDIVFHEAQADVYWALLQGRNVVLSAPTSFGKSLVIDAVVASGKYDRIAIVVPTLALIDETRRRLSKRFSGTYRVVTHSSQALGDRGILVVTQERALERKDLQKIQFFVIDEFYKLSPGRDESARSIALNQAFYRLIRQSGAQFYLLGPSIEKIPDGFEQKFNCVWIKTDFKTVVAEVHGPLGDDADRVAELVALCRRFEDPTLIYCGSLKSARTVVEILLESGISSAVTEEVEEAADWAAQEVHPEWQLIKALRKGIGLHHGKIPRPLAQFQVRAFNKRALRFLVCTSTLIEGVNTAAKNVIVFDNTVARDKFDYFTFNNIKGRSGRMFQHAVGNVYLFHAPPEPAEARVDIPFFSQPRDTPLEILLQLDPEDLTPESRERLRPVLEQQHVPVEVLRENTRTNPLIQIELGKYLEANFDRLHHVIAWDRYPTWEQLLVSSELIWDFLLDTPRKKWGIRSAKQLAFVIQQYARLQSPAAIIRSKLADVRYPRTVDQAVEETFDEIRRWANFEFPQGLLALDRIQRIVCERRQRNAGDYRFYAGQLENSFLSPNLSGLEEYGIPAQIARKLGEALRLTDSIDEALEGLQNVDLARVPLHAFERRMVRQALDEI